MDARRTAHNDSFRPDIEGLRGLAVLAVLLFHANLFGLTGGFVGVDVFFVISGFLITGLLVRERERTGRIGLLQFYARRARRLLPAATVVLIATLIVAMNVVAPLDRPSVGLDGAASALSIANLRFALAEGDYFAVVTTPSPFLHFWSLAVEEQFYLVWPALILAVARGSRPVRRIGLALVVVVVASLAASIVVTDLAPSWAFYSLPTRAWELGLGGLLALSGPAIARLPGAIVGLAGWIGLAYIAGAIVLFDATLPFPSWTAALPALGAALVIAGGSRRLGPGWLLGIAPMRFVGRISYSLYLVHWPILVLAPIALSLEPTFEVGLALVGASFLAAIAVAGLPSMGVAADGGVGTPPPTTDEPWPSDDPWPDASPTPADPSGSPPAPPSPSDPATPSPTGTPAPTGAPAPTARPDVAGHGRLPGDVKPSLGRARADEERLRGDGCLAFERVVDPPKCVYGVANGSFTVALVGDSHAAHWFPALERLAKHEGWRVVTFVKVACPFIDMRISNVALKREYRECGAFNEATIERLNRIKPNLTLISMSRIAIHPLRSSDDTVSAKAAAVARMIDRLPGPTALIVDTPYAGRDVPGCLSAHVNDVDRCAIPRATAFSDHLGGIEKAAAKATGAGLIDLTRKVCIEDPCPVVVNNIITFRDHGHLTATFSRSLAPALGWAIRDVLPADTTPRAPEGPS
jgi:peptidoglycan/LPS O-acetylase OafA/YrhL